MIIRCWGARGSIPVSGSQYLRYGGDTTCMEIRTRDDDVIIIDGGTGLRSLGKELLRQGRHTYHLIFTHAHWDHLMGVPFFRPLYRQDTRLILYGCPFAQNSIKAMMNSSMSPPHFPVKFEDVSASIDYRGACTGPFSIATVEIVPILLSHPNQGIGYRFTEDRKTFVFLTDNELLFQHPGGLTYDKYTEFARNADFLIHDAEFTEAEYRTTRGWGHTAYKDALRLALDAGVRRLGLFHHNQDRTDGALDALVNDCRTISADKGSSLECVAMAEGMEIRL